LWAAMAATAILKLSIQVIDLLSVPLPEKNYHV
jgi:hypothetical protein